MPLGPGLVNHRVVVRCLVPGETGPSGGPAMTDVIGVLVRWGDEDIVVRRESGEAVTLPRRLIVTGKAVPPKPTRRPRD